MAGRSSSSKMSRQEAGRKGAEARWGHQENENRGNSRSGSLSRQQRSVRSGNSERSGRDFERNEGDENFGGRGGSRLEHQRAGQMGAEARLGRSGSGGQGNMIGQRSNRGEEHQTTTDKKWGEWGERTDGKMIKDAAMKDNTQEASVEVLTSSIKELDVWAPVLVGVTTMMRISKIKEVAKVDRMLSIK